MMYEDSHLSQPTRQSVLVQKELLLETLPQIRKVLALESTGSLLACVDVMAHKLRILDVAPLHRARLVVVWVPACFCACGDGRRSKCR